MDRRFGLPAFYQDCESDEERVTYIIFKTGGIVRFTLLVERMHDARLRLSHEKLLEILASLLEKEKIERIEDGRFSGYRFIDNPNERYGNSVPVMEQPHVVTRDPVGFDPMKNPSPRCTESASRDIVPVRKMEKANSLTNNRSVNNVIPSAPLKTKTRGYIRRIEDEELLKFIEAESPSTREISRFLSNCAATTIARLKDLVDRGLINRAGQGSPWLLTHTFMNRESRIAAKRRLDQRRNARRLARQEVLERRGKIKKKLSPKKREERNHVVRKRINPNRKTDEEILEFIKAEPRVTADVKLFLNMSRTTTLERLTSLKRRGEIKKQKRNKPWVYKDVVFELPPERIRKHEITKQIVEVFRAQKSILSPEELQEVKIKVLEVFNSQPVVRTA